MDLNEVLLTELLNTFLHPFFVTEVTCQIRKEIYITQKEFNANYEALRKYDRIVVFPLSRKLRKLFISEIFLVKPELITYKEKLDLDKEKKKVIN